MHAQPHHSFPPTIHSPPPNCKCAPLQTRPPNAALAHGPDEGVHFSHMWSRATLCVLLARGCCLKPRPCILEVACPTPLSPLPQPGPAPFLSWCGQVPLAPVHDDEEKGHPLVVVVEPRPFPCASWWPSAGRVSPSPSPAWNACCWGARGNSTPTHKRRLRSLHTRAARRTAPHPLGGPGREGRKAEGPPHVRRNEAWALWMDGFTNPTHHPRRHHKHAKPHHPRLIRTTLSQPTGPPHSTPTYQKMKSIIALLLAAPALAFMPPTPAPQRYVHQTVTQRQSERERERAVCCAVRHYALMLSIQM